MNLSLHMCSLSWCTNETHNSVSSAENLDLPWSLEDKKSAWKLITSMHSHNTFSHNTFWPHGSAFIKFPRIENQNVINRVTREWAIQRGAYKISSYVFVLAVGWSLQRGLWRWKHRKVWRWMQEWGSLERPAGKSSLWSLLKGRWVIC